MMLVLGTCHCCACSELSLEAFRAAVVCHIDDDNSGDAEQGGVATGDGPRKRKRDEDGSGTSGDAAADGSDALYGCVGCHGSLHHANAPSLNTATGVVLAVLCPGRVAGRCWG